MRGLALLAVGLVVLLFGPQSFRYLASMVLAGAGVGELVISMNRERGRT
jgi:hypothetical protein